MILWVTEQGGTRYSEADLPLEIGGSTGDTLLIEGVEDQRSVAVLDSQSGRDCTLRFAVGVTMPRFSYVESSFNDRQCSADSATRVLELRTKMAQL